MTIVLSEGEKRALKDLLNAALSTSDVGFTALGHIPNPIPSDTMFMLMLIHLRAKLNKIEKKLEKGDRSLSSHYLRPVLQ